MPIAKRREPDSIKQAWLNLASDVLLLAIEDVRQTRDSYKRENAKDWLLSPAAKLLFDSLDFEIDLRNWVKAGCPMIGKR
jgi:hypothetical protein